MNEDFFFFHHLLNFWQRLGGGYSVTAGTLSNSEALWGGGVTDTGLVTGESNIRWKIGAKSCSEMLMELFWCEAAADDSLLFNGMSAVSKSVFRAIDEEYGFLTL